MYKRQVLDFWLTAGPYAEQFEKKLGEFIGVREVVPVNSGSSANLVAMTTLCSRQLPDGLRPGDEVIVPAVSFPTTVNPIIQNRLVPVFVDSCLGDFNLNVAQLEEAVSPRTRALVFAHTPVSYTHLDVYKRQVQAYVWGVLQMGVLAGGLLWLVVDPGSRRTLRPIIVGVALLAHVANFFNYPEIIPSGTEVIYWLRLGYLVAFPLWAVLAYRDSMRGLLTTAEAERAQSAQLAHNLRLSTAVIAARIPEVRLDVALDMAAGLVATQFAAIGLIDEKNPQRVLFSQTRPAASRDSAYGRQINLNDHAAFRLAYEQQRGIELLPRGVGARQVHDLSQQFNVGALGPVFVEPLVVAGHCFGFLLLAAPPTAENWTDRDRAIVPSVAAFVAQAVANSRRLENETPPRPARCV